MSNPYSKLNGASFWKTSTASISPFDISSLWSPKFLIEPEDKITTYGSCFAQHFGRSLSRFGFTWNVIENPPTGLSEADKKLFNYNVFSSRTGNIYTTSLLLQWTRWAIEPSLAPQISWEKDDRFYDPFRPAIEPNGFSSHQEVIESRSEALRCFKDSITTADVFVFTLGLTERWIDVDGYEYPMCPGTIAGDFNEERHLFNNMTFVEARRDLLTALNLVKELNPELRVLLTVSPVPLTATASSRHVLVATVASKSILRAVADDVQLRQSWVDYFPSYEIITGIPFRSMFYEPNLRSVNPAGVNFVMRSFFNDLVQKYPRLKKRINSDAPDDTVQEDNEVACEEELLDAFGGKS